MLRTFMTMVIASTLFGAMSSRAQEALPRNLASVVKDRITARIKDAQGRSFAEFTKLAPIDLPTARAGIRPDLTASDFQALAARHARFYGSLKVVSTLHMKIPGSADTVAYDCVLSRSQPAAQGVQDEEPPPTPASAASRQPRAMSAGSECPLGSVALRRFTLAEMIALPRHGEPPSQEGQPHVDRDALRSLLGRPPKPAAAHVHRYAHAVVQMPNLGAHARLNVWSPRVLQGDESISQLWLVAGDPDTTALQTVEAGWQVLDQWHTPFSAFFVYFTADNYTSTGCYATNCTDPAGDPFIVKTTRPLIGAPIASQSHAGGVQGTVDVWWQRSATGSWWLNVDGDWVGYYPASTFKGGALAHGADYADFGGETTGVFASAEMGSGHFAQDGPGMAAYQSHIEIFDMNGVARAPAAMIPSAETACYTIAIGGPVQPETDPGAFFFFGGPGTRHFPSPPANEGLACTGP